MKNALERHMFMLINLLPPFLGAGIRVKQLQQTGGESTSN